jgi:hypothetical protein|tara:strand:- start:432 stop:638 length:207 start_codon:yes stop_codon:yes gene_type:complete
MRYTTKKLMQVLDLFCKEEAGQQATVMLILPEGRAPDQKEFNIKEVKLVENKLVGPQYDKYRTVILVE